MDRMILESFPFRVIEKGWPSQPWQLVRVKEFSTSAMSTAGGETRARSDYGTGTAGGWAKNCSALAGPSKLSVFEGRERLFAVKRPRFLRRRPAWHAEVAPAVSRTGVLGQPTLINNVETLAMCPWILRNGAEKVFRHRHGEKQRGTKVFALAGKIRAAAH